MILYIKHQHGSMVFTALKTEDMTLEYPESHDSYKQTGPCPPHLTFRSIHYQLSVA